MTILLVLFGLTVAEMRPQSTRRTDAAAAASVPRRPNILWISAEDLSPDLGAYGDPYARTPNLDKFAREGVRFTRAFSVAPVCAPSRSSIITGMYPTTIGTMHMRSNGVPPPHVKPFTEYLRAAGYYTTNNVKTDYNFPSPDTAWDESSNQAHWRNRPDKSQPFFAVFNLVVTHESQIRTPAEVFARNTSKIKPEDRHDPTRAVLPPYYPDTPLVRRDWARYYDLITAMDLQAAELLKQLEEDGLADNTVVLFWGDHGRGLPRAKRWLYDSGTRVPLIARYPGKLKPGTVSDDLVTLMDLGPTMLSLAGVEVPVYMQGRAFLGERAASPREYVFAHRDRMDETYDMIRTVRGRRFRYIRNFQAGKPYAQHIEYMDEMPTMKEWRRLNKEDAVSHLQNQEKGVLTPAQRIFFASVKPEEELYDTEADPHEINNLAPQPEHSARLKAMRRVLDDWMKETKDLGSVPELELNQRMRPGGVWQVTAPPVISEVGKAANGTTRVKLTSPTEGASIAYTFDPGDKPRWQLYTKELTVTDMTALRAKSCRLGYKDSPEVRATLSAR